MRTLKIEQLSVEAFVSFGFYADTLNPCGEKIGTSPIEFYRDMLQQDLGQNGACSFSVCKIEKRAYVIDVAEYHSFTAESILPLDNDILIHVGPATADEQAPCDKLRVFRVPQGTMVVLRPGVWHHAPFAENDRPANVLVVLPERAYANDCNCVYLKPENHMMIERQ